MGEGMTGIPVFDAVFDFIKFVRMLAGIGIAASVVFFASVVLGLIAPNTWWGLLVERHITGYWRPRGPSPLWIGGVVLLVCLAVWFGLAGFGSQTSPEYPWLSPR
jgi:hypothetical protein